MNNRLDYISNFDPLAYAEMERFRMAFAELDSKLQDLLKQDKTALARCIALARTKIEEAQFYAMKSVVLKYELPVKNK